MKRKFFMFLLVAVLVVTSILGCAACQIIEVSSGMSSVQNEVQDSELQDNRADKEEEQGEQENKPNANHNSGSNNQSGNSVIGVSSVSLNQTDITLQRGETINLYATVSPSNASYKNVTWETSNVLIASVSKGVVTARMPGVAVITVEAHNGKKATCTLTVSPFVFSPFGEGYELVEYIGCNQSETVTVPSSYKGEPVVAIGESAFWLYGNLKQITIPDSVTNIGEKAFYGCDSLQEITIPFVGAEKEAITDTTFCYLFGGTTSDIPKGLTKVTITGGDVMEEAFADCSTLNSVVLKDGITSIGAGAFRGCERMQSIVLPNGITDISGETFWGCTSLINIIIPDSVKTIGFCAFAYCDALKSVVIPNGVTSIGEGAFASCERMQSIVLPNGITDISREAFGGCTSLINIIIPDSVKTIGFYAFAHCDALKSVVIPNSVTSIGEGAFVYCESLDNVIMSNGVTSIGESAFAYSGLLEVIIPNSVTSIGSYAFSGCDKMVKAVIPNSVTSIGDFAFSLESMIIYCEAITKPSGWSDIWSYDCCVVWDSKNNDVPIIPPSESVGSITLPTCPMAVEYWAYSQDLFGRWVYEKWYAATITEISYTIEKKAWGAVEISVTIKGEKTWSFVNSSKIFAMKYKLKDGEGVVISDGNIFTESCSVGEKFIETEIIYISDLENYSGQWTLELMNYETVVNT